MKHRNTQRRKGNVLVMTAFMMTMLITFVALAVDIGYLYTVRNELQRTADAAAIAATWELVDQDRLQGIEGGANLEENARNRAAQYAGLNLIGSSAPSLAEDDVEVGYMADPSDPNCPLEPAGGGILPNAVRVRVQRTSTQNGEVPLFFARILGMTHQSAQAQATAALLYGFNGFEMPRDGTNLMMLPFAVKETTWNAMLAGAGNDAYAYNPSTKSVGAGSDGILECNLFPYASGQPGNFGTLDLGSDNNSTADLCRQILNGVNQTDFNSLTGSGRSLTFNENGVLLLNGDTGVSAGVASDLSTIKGLPRLIPIYREVVGPGNNAEFTICKFVGVRVMDVRLTGSIKDKKVIVQPCNMIAKGAIRSDEGMATDYVYSPVWLVR